MAFRQAARLMQLMRYRAGRIIIGLSSMPPDAGVVLSHSTCQTGRWAYPNACFWLRDHDEGNFVDLAQSLNQILIELHCFKGPVSIVNKQQSDLKHLDNNSTAPQIVPGFDFAKFGC